MVKLIKVLQTFHFLHLTRIQYLPSKYLLIFNNKDSITMFIEIVLNCWLWKGIWPCRYLLVQSQQWKHKINVRHLFKYYNKDTRMKSMISFWCILFLTLNRFHISIWCWFWKANADWGESFFKCSQYFMLILQQPSRKRAVLWMKHQH